MLGWNRIATFTSATTGKTVTAPVCLSATQTNAPRETAFPAETWQVDFNVYLRYPDGSAIGTNDTVTLDRVPGSPMTITISRPVPSADPLDGTAHVLCTDMTNTATIVRVGQTVATVPCSILPVPPGRGSGRFRDVQTYLPLQQWAIRMPDGTPVAPGDQATVKDGSGNTVGVYRVLERSTTGTQAPATIAYAALSDAAADILVTDSVRFKRGGSNEIIPTSGTFNVGIAPISNEDAITREGTGFTHVVLYDLAAAVFADGSTLSVNDAILYKGKHLALRRPAPYVPINIGMAYFTVAGA